MSYSCRFCTTPVVPFMDMGRMPLANGFLDADQLNDELFYNLRPAVCGTCKSFQLVELPDSSKIFHPDYPHVTGLSQVVGRHFQGFADDVHARFLTGSDPFVLEIGSNDGTLLKNFARRGIRHLGVEPAERAAELARADGIDTLCCFFDADAAADIRRDHGPADAVLGANAIAHIPDIRAVGEGVRTLLGDDGIFVFENIYLRDLIEQSAYDQIYDEHVFTYSVTSVARVYAAFDLELIDVEAFPMQGGSLRYTLAPQGRRKPSPAVGEFLEQEASCGLHGSKVLAEFRSRAESNRDAMIDLVRDLKSKGHRIAGYGAATKSTVTMNYCRLTADDIDYIVDATPAKQGKLSPGTHVPVVPPQKFHDDPPDFTIMFAWNHFAEIRAKEPAFEAGGGRWIVPMPEPRIIAPPE